MNEIALQWIDDLRFEGRAGSRKTAIDGDGEAGPSPVNLLLESIAACAAADVVDILRKGRQGLEALRVEVRADRRPDPPRYVKRLAMHFALEGDVLPARARRAVDLSLEKYCSVFHSLRMDISLDVLVAVNGSVVE